MSEIDDGTSEATHQIAFTIPPLPAWTASPIWDPPQMKSPTKTKSIVKTVGVVAGGALVLAAGIGIGHGWWTSGSSPLSGSSSAALSLPTGGSSTSSGGTSPSAASAIASKVDPGLVDIDTTFNYSNEQAAGTGLVLTSSGEILTNNHVIEGATSIKVTDVNNGQTYSATVVGYDVSSDLAVLQLQGASGLQTVSIGNSSSASVGESVVGIGNAGGLGGTPSSASGVVTALDQSITAQDDGNRTSEQLTGLIQTSADIEPGDSGGPIVNDNGQVLGIDTAGSNGTEFSTSTGVGYAIPINEAITIAKQIESGQSSSEIHIGLTAFLGVEVEASAIASADGLGGADVTVAGVIAGDPADEAGIAAGDVITTVNGTPIDSPSALTDALGTRRPGNSVQIGWNDTSGQAHTATVELISGPPA